VERKEWRRNENKGKEKKNILTTRKKGRTNVKENINRIKTKKERHRPKYSEVNK
jgi:hypothetical protein